MRTLPGEISAITTINAALAGASTSTPCLVRRLLHATSRSGHGNPRMYNLSKDNDPRIYAAPRTAGSRARSAPPTANKVRNRHAQKDGVGP